MREGSGLDRLTQRWVRRSGRRVDLRAAPWLDGPVGRAGLIADRWIGAEAARLGGTAATAPDGGLLDSLGQLAGEGFDPSAVHPDVRGFYESTAQWRMEAWSAWRPLARPAGALISGVFSRRLQQLALPLDPMDTARGMDSEVTAVRGAGGSLLGAAWVRRLRATGQTVYSGWYSAVALPGRSRPSIRVVFPLPNGSVTVFLRPSVNAEGHLALVSPLGPFGGDGAYLVVRSGGSTAWARRIPVVERFDVYPDGGGTVRADHDLRLGRLRALHLHYRMDRR
ncbi:hypothetical protein [Nocardiopsis coralliicola]